MSIDDFQKLMNETSIVNLLLNLIITKHHYNFEPELLALFFAISYNPNLNKDMITSNFSEKFCKLFDRDIILLDKKCLHHFLGIIYNLSFYPQMCACFIKAGYINKLNHIIDVKYHYLKICIYHNFSLEQEYASWFSRTNVLTQLLEDINQGKICFKEDEINITKVLPALLINLTISPVNCDTMVKDVKTFELFAHKVISLKDGLYMKALKNISYNNPESLKLLSKDLIISLGQIDPGILHYHVELLALLGNMQDLGEFALTNMGGDLEKEFCTDMLKKDSSTYLEDVIIPFLVSHISLGDANEDLLFNIVIFINALAIDEAVAGILVNKIALLDILSEMMKGKQEDDEFVCQIVYTFYVLLFHQSIQTQVLTHESVLPIIIDLMNDKNEYIKEMCTIMINKVTEVDPENWGRLIHEEMFLRHNAFWLEMVNDVPTHNL